MQQVCLTKAGVLFIMWILDVKVYRISQILTNITAREQLPRGGFLLLKLANFEALLEGLR